MFRHDLHPYFYYIPSRFRNIETTKKDFCVFYLFSTRELLKFKRILYPLKNLLALYKDKCINLNHDLVLNCMSQPFWKNFVVAISAGRFKFWVIMLEITGVGFLHSQSYKLKQ